MVRSLWALVLVAGCGAGETTADREPAEELTTRATVLESKDHGPALCFGVDQSLPPQCEDIPMANWDWSEVPGEESLRGTTWGEGYVVVGTYDGERFALTRPVRRTEQEPPPDQSRTRCPEPDLGRAASDPGATREDELRLASAVARRLPDFSYSWVDRSTPMVLTVAVTGDPAVARKALVEVWPGALCVTQTAHTQKELRRIQSEVNAVEGMLSSYVGEGFVSVGVKYDDGTLQRQLDAKYGAGAVMVTSALTPYSR